MSRHVVPRNPPDPNQTAAASKRDRLRPGLYLVATPIGNLGDITRRAVAILSGADIIAAEDTRVARRLLSALGIAAPRLMRYDDHAEAADRDRLIEAVKQGKIVALMADAGTPLVADPGLKLVRSAQAAGIPVTAAPGPSAVLTALSLAGLPSDRFLFAGFLPAKDGARRRAVSDLAAVPATLIFFETPPRLAASLATLAELLGPRDAVMARELTKLFEEVRRAPLPELAAAYAQAEPPKGEIVLVIAPPSGEMTPTPDADIDAQLSAALNHASLKDAVTAVAGATGRRRSDVYARALDLKKGDLKKDGS